MDICNEDVFMEDMDHAGRLKEAMSQESIVMGGPDEDDEDNADNNDTPPPVAIPTARKIPEGSTVRRRLFADDGPAEASRNPNMINSTNDVNRMLQEEEKRAAQRFNFDIQREEPIPNGGSPWRRDAPYDPRGEIRKRRMQKAEACRRRMVIERYKLYRFEENSDPQYMNAVGHLDNLTNNLMDDSQECYAESVQHWNFDFDNKRPSAEGGRVSWQQVGPHWIGHSPGVFTKLVLYPYETKNGANTLSHEAALKEIGEGKHLLSEHVNAIYGDWKREMTAGIKIATVNSNHMNIERTFLGEMRLLKLTNEHHLITKSEAIALIRGEDPAQNAAIDDHVADANEEGNVIDNDDYVFFF